MKDSATSAGQRRQLSRAARDAFPALGIYAVRNRDRHVRVGSSRNVHATLNRIQFELRLGTHPDRPLQADWDRDPSSLVFEVLELVKQRSDPAFDYAAELGALEEIYRAELGIGSDA